MEGEKPLGSWKEISAYLQCSLRTCQRWEKELDLPVHRLDGTPKARVFAYRAEIDAWLAGKLDHADVLTGRRGRTGRMRLRRGLTMALLGAGILTAGAILVSRAFFPQWIAPPDIKPSLAVLTFENATGEKNFDDWRTTLPDLVVTDLAQSRFVNVTRFTELYRALVAAGLGEADRFTDEEMRGVAERVGTEYLATGAIRREGRDLFVDVSVSQLDSGEAPRTFRLGLSGEVGAFETADRMSEKIRSLLLPDRKYLTRDIDREVQRISTASPEAFKLFSLGCRLAGTMKLQEGIALLQRAVEIDPEFALAYKYLWRSCINADRKEDEETYIRKAVELSDRMSERERGDLRVLYYRDHEKDPTKERAALERLWRYHPDDRFGGIQLLASYIAKEEWDEALPVARMGLAANRKEAIFNYGLARCQANLGRIDESEATIGTFIASNRDHPYWAEALRLRVDCRLLQGNYEEALTDLETLTRRFPNNEPIYIGIRSRIRIHMGDFGKAEAEIAKLLAQKNARAKVEALMLTRDIRLLQGRIGEAKRALRQGLEITGWTEDNAYLKPRLQAAMHGEMGYLHRITGDLNEALKETDAALLAAASSPGPRSVPFELLKLRALLLLEMNRPDDFARGVREVREAIEKQPNAKLMRIWHLLMGLKDLKMNNVSRTIDHLWKAIDLLSVPGYDLQGADPEYFYSLAEAYMRRGRGEILKALSMYEKVVRPTVNHLHSGDLYALSLFRMAGIHDRLSSEAHMSDDEICSAKSKAVKNYGKFLALWKNADPIFSPEIEHARRRLVALGGD